MYENYGSVLGPHKQFADFTEKVQILQNKCKILKKLTFRKKCKNYREKCDKKQ